MAEAERISEETTVDEGQQETLIDQGDESSPEENETQQEAESTDQDDSSGDKDAEDKESAPETYAEFDIPEGMPVDEKATEQFSEVAKDLGLTQEQAQKLVSLEAERMTQMQATSEEAQATVVAGWVDEVKADPEIGGANLDANLGIAKAAVETFASDELKALMDMPSAENPKGIGLGNHPAMIRHFYKLGTQMSEDKPGVVGNVTHVQKSAADTLYPSKEN